MKILLILDDSLPGSYKIAARMMFELAEILNKQGHEAVCIAPCDSLTAPYEVYIHNNVSYVRFKCGSIKNVSKVKRLINEFQLSRKALRNLKPYFESNKFDGIIYYSPSIFWGTLVKVLKKKWDCKSYMILRDIFPQWAVDNKIIPKNGPIHKFFKFYEKINYNAADTIGLQSPLNLEDFRSRGLNIELDVIYNWNSDNYECQEKLDDLKCQFGWMGKVVYFYGGNMGHAQDMLNLMRLAKSMAYSKAHFVFVGQGDEVELMKDYVVNNHLKNTDILEAVEQEDYKKMVKASDVCMFSLHKDHLTHNFPGKLLGYMSASKPILGSINSKNDVEDLLVAHEAGLISLNGNDKDFHENGAKLLSSVELRLSLGTNGKKLLKEVFSPKKAYLKIIEKL